MLELADARLVMLCALTSFALSGCGADTDPFVPLDKLCARYADEVCLGQSSCCERPLDDCTKEWAATCSAARDGFAAETTRSYDSQRAAGIFGSMASELRDCQDPFPVARFFQGGLSDGESCERGPQCATGACGDDDRCEAESPIPLCGQTADAGS